MEGLLAEGSEMMEEEADEEVRDAGLIAAAQRVEHYEISGYGTARLRLASWRQGGSEASSNHMDEERKLIKAYLLVRLD